ncbi:DNA starvation/stationary phase protection protein [Natronorubrum sp. JWXQ-INN-674]|uniref:DNA starvation/stationary phase protection protein n=1 Tax=Natronorubrum halalkaliphilum TaxID=2691917 RepID=A0A6B0VMV6_9EURY|nr:DNA starvation/stationary phase protection protein DpsA [Natronorubrum halalkaliphilum]MXV61889.1 DNA starvation/stationary phase protection protein [Natronorubrum halalkaliphilum]
MGSTPHLRKPDPDHLRQQWDTVRGNELRLERETAKRIVEALNAELSGLYILFNQVRKHYWLVEGAESNDVGDFLEGAADRLTGMTDALAIRVHALGGVPVCGPMGVRQHAPIEIEDSHHYDVRSSLERDLDGYATLAVQMRDHVELVDQLGDETTGELLREHLTTIEADAHTIEKYLADDTLVWRGPGD